MCNCECGGEWSQVQHSDGSTEGVAGLCAQQAEQASCAWGDEVCQPVRSSSVSGESRLGSLPAFFRSLLARRTSCAEAMSSCSQICSVSNPSTCSSGSMLGAAAAVDCPEEGGAAALQAVYAYSACRCVVCQCCKSLCLAWRTCLACARPNPCHAESCRGQEMQTCFCIGDDSHSSFP